MSRIKILENEREIPLDQAFYLKHSGSINYFLTLDIRGGPRSTGSSLMIFAYSKPDRHNIIATEFAYKRIFSQKTESVNNRSNCYRCGVKDIQAYIEVTVRAIEEDYQGEIKIVYGPVELDNLTKDKYTRAKADPRFQIECSGKADNKRDFTLLCFHQDLLIAKDANLNEVKRMKIVPEMMVVSNSVNPNKLKVVLPALNSELALDFDEVRDKDVALLLIEHKKKMVIDGKSNMLRTGGLPEEFRIEKKSNHDIVFGRKVGEDTLNDTFRDNLHSLNDLLQESQKADSQRPAQPPQPKQNPRIVIKEVDSFDEAKNARPPQKNARVPGSDLQSNDNVITFVPKLNPSQVSEVREEKKALSRRSEEVRVELKNPYHPSARRQMLFHKKTNQVLEPVYENQPMEKSSRRMEDISEELVGFDGMSEKEMDRMINQVFKKDKVKVERYGEPIRESVSHVQKNLKETDSFFHDVEVSRDFHEMPVGNFYKKQENVQIAPPQDNVGNLGMLNKKEYKALYNKLRDEFEVEKNLELNQKLQERETRNEKKVRRLVETQKGLMRELKLLREKREDSILMEEELEKEKERGLRLQIQNLGKKYSQIKKDWEGERQQREGKEQDLEMMKSKVVELENQNYDFKMTVEERAKEIGLLRESTQFLEKKIRVMENEKEDLVMELEEKQKLSRNVEQLVEEVARKDQDLRNLKVSLYEVEVNEQILMRQNNEEKEKTRNLKKEVEKKELNMADLERDLKMVGKHRDELDRELRLRKGAGLVEEEKRKLEKEIRQFQEFSRKKDGEIEMLRSQVGELKEERMRVEMFYKEKRNEKESLLENEIKDWERDVERKDKKIRDLEFERNISSRELEEKAKEIERLRADVEKYRKMEAEFLHTVQMMNEEQERESMRSQKTRELDETRDKLIKKLRHRLKNETVQNDLMQRTNDGLVRDVDRLREEKLKYLDLIKSLKQKLITRTEHKTRPKHDPLAVESDDSIDVGLLKNEQYISRKFEENSYERRYENVKNMNTIRSELFQKEMVAYPQSALQTDSKKQQDWRIVKNEGFMFQSNAASFKGLTGTQIPDSQGAILMKNNEVFELKTQLAMRNKKVNELENVN